MQFELNAQSRTLQGTGASRRLRRAGKVPGIVYGGEGKPASIELEHNPLLLALRKEAFHSSLIKIALDGKQQEVLLRDVQMHPYKPLVLHIDFQRVTRGVAIHQWIPLHFLNAEIAPGVKLGHGIPAHVMTEIEIECLPRDLPEFIEVDLKALELGESIHVSELKLPAGVKIVRQGQDDGVVVTVAPPQKEEVDAPVETEAVVAEKGKTAAADADKKEKTED